MTDPTAQGAYWNANAAPAPARGTLNIELDVDVCVIGAGLAGLTVALEVARRGWSVAVLEARRVAWNASGRNAGVVTPGFAADIQSLVGKIGLQHAKQLWILSEAGVEYVRRTARDMPGADLVENGWLHVSKTGDDGRLAAQAEFLNRETATAAQFWPASQVRAQLRSKRYFGALHLPGAFSINPLNYALGLAAAAEAAGVRIFEETPVLEIDPAGVRKRIVTPAARLRAGHVVLAGNVHIDTLRPELAGTLLETWAYSIVTESLGEGLHDAIRFGGAVTDDEAGDGDYRIVGGDRLLWSDRCTVWEGAPRRYARKLLADIRGVYPQLGKVSAEYAWAGAIGTPVHGMPQIGEVTPGVWVLSGFDGQGINTTAMGAEIVAAAIVEGSQSWRLFQPFDLVWAGGRLGLATVQLFTWYGRSRERLLGALARRRRVIEPDVAIEPELAATAASDPAPAAEPAKRRKRKTHKSKPDASPGGDTPAPT